MNRNESHWRVRSSQLALGWILACLVFGPTGVLGAGEPESGDAGDTTSAAAQTWYAQTRVATDFGIVSTHYWSKGALFRAETMLAGHPVITIVNGPRYYVFDSVVGKGAAIERNPKSIGEDRDRGRPFGRELDDLIASGGEKIEDVSLSEAGASFEIYQLTNDNGRRRVVVTKSVPQLPFRVETFVRKTATDGRLEYSGWQRGLEIEDSFFEPPALIRFENVTYDQYTVRVGKVPIGPAPVYYRDLLHGRRRATD